MSAAVGGADVVVIGTTIGTLVQNLMVRPEIEKSGATARQVNRYHPFRHHHRHGSAHCAAPFRASCRERCIDHTNRRHGIDRAGDGPAAACKAASFPIPRSDRPKSSASRAARHRLFEHALCIHGHCNARRGHSQRTGTRSQQYMTAQVEAIARMKRDRPFTIGVMSKFLRTE